MDRATISVPASSANVGLGYDIWCLGLAQPHLLVTAVRQPSGVVIERAASPLTPPEGRRLGVAGQVALERFLRDQRITGGARLIFEDAGYPVGGLGRSGAEAVGAVMAAAVLYGVKLTRDQVVMAAAHGEPGEHKDNVAASTNGRFNIIATSPETGQPSVDVYAAPPDLSIGIGYSSFQKSGGTEALRAVLRQPVPGGDFVLQSGLVSAATAALVSGNTARFLELVWGDRFHEPRRADAGGYGPFAAADLAALKARLFRDHRTALNISGAGPNIQLLYSKKDHAGGIPPAASKAVIAWFLERGIHMTVQETAIAPSGAYDDAQRRYGY